MDNTRETESTATFENKLGEIQADLEAGLQRGRGYADLFDTLISTNDTNELLESAKKLADYQANSEYVVFPKQFENSDYYLIFMARLMEIKQFESNLTVEIQTAKDGHQLLRHVQSDSHRSFRFDKRTDKVVYLNQDAQKAIFEIDFVNRTMSFDTDTINQIYFINSDENQSVQMDQEINLFKKFGELLESTYQFRVDFNMFDTDNSKVYRLAQSGMKHDIMDQLFVMSAKNHFILLNDDEKYGAKLNLDEDVVMSIFQEDETNDQWAIKVDDQQGRYSLFNVLEKYEFLNQWYIANINNLKLKMIM